nr:hypothetical protein [Microbacterium bovistercoris]
MPEEILNPFVRVEICGVDRGVDEDGRPRRPTTRGSDMYADTMSHAAAREFSDRICDMRWEREQERMARRRAAVARHAAFIRSIPTSFAVLLHAGTRG